MPSSKVMWLLVSPLIAANLVWFYLTVMPWMQDHDPALLARMGVQLAITLVLGALPILCAFIEDKRFKAKRQRQARAKRVSWQADQLDNVSE